MKNNIVVIVIVALSMFLTIAVANAETRAQRIERMLYHSQQLLEDMEATDLKEKEALIKKVVFIREKLKQEVLGKQSSIRETRPVMGEQKGGK